MSDTAKRIYTHFQTKPQYMYSTDMSVKRLEKLAIDELEKDGYILVKMRTIGYVIAEILQ